MFGSGDGVKVEGNGLEITILCKLILLLAERPLAPTLQVHLRRTHHHTVLPEVTLVSRP